MSSTQSSLLTSSIPSAGRSDEVSSSPVHRVFYPALDGIRTVAFLMVFFHHYLLNTWGWVGVDVFFALSGFLITGILFQTRNRPHRFKTFYMRRVLRIFPLYYGVFAVLLLLTPLLHFQWNRFWFFWVFHLGNYLRDFSPSTFAGNGLVPYGILSSRLPWLRLYAGHFWSLCVEEQFYFVWPVVVFTIRRQRPLLVLCLSSFLLMLPVRLWLVHAHLKPEMLNGLLGWATPFRADALLLGGALALWLHQPSGARAVQSRARVSPLFAAAVASITAWLLSDHNFLLPPAGSLFSFPLVDLAAACLVFEALRPSSLVAKILSWHPLRQFGKLTYGAYVFHQLPHTLYARVTQHLFRFATPAAQVYISALIALACTAALAWASYHFYESWFLQWKDRLARE